jgi:hypothetical protein
MIDGDEFSEVASETLGRHHESSVLCHTRTYTSITGPDWGGHDAVRRVDRHNLSGPMNVVDLR